MKWKWILIIGGIILFYFASGLSQHYQPEAVLGGIVIGSVVTFLFGKAKEEAVHNANTNTNTQTVNVNMSKTRVDGTGFTEEQLATIYHLVEARENNKLLVSESTRGLPLPQELDRQTQSERLLELLRIRRQNNV